MDNRKIQFTFEGLENVIAMFKNSRYICRKNLYHNIKSYARCISGNVLDFGCGSKPYKELFAHCKSYVGCDIQISGHDHKNEEIDYYYNGKKLPFSDQTFDWIFSSEVFEHIFNLDEILDELNRVLVHGGGMLVTVPFVWNEHEIPYDCARYTSFGIKMILEKHGFEILELKKSSIGIEAIAQIILIYLNGVIWEISFRNRYVSSVLRSVILCPIILITMILAKLFPYGNDFYLNNIVLCKKVS